MLKGQVEPSGTIGIDTEAKDIFESSKRAKRFMKESYLPKENLLCSASQLMLHLSLVSTKRKPMNILRTKNREERQYKSGIMGPWLKEFDTGVGMIMNFVKEMEIERQYLYLFLMGSTMAGTLTLTSNCRIDENQGLVKSYYSNATQQKSSFALWKTLLLTEGGLGSIYGC